MHPNATKVAAAATELGLDVEVREFPEGTRTAEDAAAAIGVELGQIVKSLVFAVDGRVVVALVPGDRRLDEKRLAVAAGGDACERVDATAVRNATGYPVGGVPPFGYPAPLPTFADDGLLRYDRVWAAAGTPRHVFGVAPAALVAATNAAVVELSA